MKKILLALIISISGSAIAKSDSGINLLQKASANSGIQQILSSKTPWQCEQLCINDFLSCIAVAQGPWVECEIWYERCASDCGI